MAAEELTVEVAFGTGERQALVTLKVAPGTTVREAIEKSAIADAFEGLDISTAPVGIFSRRVGMDTVVSEGDRIEIYRPLLMDPKEARRQRAKKGEPRG